MNESINESMNNESMGQWHHEPVSQWATESRAHCINEPMHSMIQCLTEPLNQGHTASMSQCLPWANVSMSHWIKGQLHQWANAINDRLSQCFKESMHQWTNEYKRHDSMSQLINETMSQCINPWIYAWSNQWLDEPITGAIQELINDSLHDWMAELMNASMN